MGLVRGRRPRLHRVLGWTAQNRPFCRRRLGEIVNKFGLASGLLESLGLQTFDKLRILGRDLFSRRQALAAPVVDVGDLFVHVHFFGDVQVVVVLFSKRLHILYLLDLILLVVLVELLGQGSQTLLSSRGSKDILIVTVECPLI